MTDLSAAAEQLTEARQAHAAERTAVDLLGSVATLQARLMALLRRAERSRNLRTALLAVREAARLLELHGRLSGQLDASGCIAIQVNAGRSANADTIRERVMAKLQALSVPPPMIDADAVTNDAAAAA
jgi:hypothetical protein